MDESRIAKYPREKRSESNLLILDKDSGRIRMDKFSNIINYLPRKTMIVANNSHVIPARLIGKKPTGGKVEFMPLTPMPIILRNTRQENGLNIAEISGLFKSSKPVKENERIEISPELAVTVLKRRDFGKCDVVMAWKGNLEQIIDAKGHVPLPPYMKRESEYGDLERYQTVYSDKNKKGKNLKNSK